MRIQFKSANHSELAIQNNCIAFYASEVVLSFMHHRAIGVCGILEIEFTKLQTVLIHFSYSPSGNDGHICVQQGELKDEQILVVKQLIIAYSVNELCKKEPS